MNIGGGSPAYVLDDAELQRVGSAASIVIGESGVQAGAVTLTTVTSPLTSVPFSVFANGTGGGIVLVDANDGNETGAALRSGGAGALSLTAGSGGITTTTGTNATAELSTTGEISLTTTGGLLGATGNRVQFPGSRSG